MNVSGFLKQSGRLVLPSLTLSVLLVALTACGGSDKPKEQAGGGQVLAKVGDEEITDSRFNFAVQRLGPSAANDNARSRLLDQMVNQAMMAQEARKNGLDRRPEMVQSQEFYSRQLLSEFYLKGLQDVSASEPTTAEILEFYNARPLDFAQRKFFDLRVVSVPSKDYPASLNQAMSQLKTWSSFVSVLDNSGVGYTHQPPMTDLGSLPDIVRQKIQTAQPGDVIRLTDTDQITLVFVANVMNSPLTVAEARPVIIRAIAQRKIKERIDAELDRLRSVYKPELSASFYKPASTATK